MIILRLYSSRSGIAANVCTWKVSSEMRQSTAKMHLKKHNTSKIMKIVILGEFTTFKWIFEAFRDTSEEHFKLQTFT